MRQPLVLKSTVLFVLLAACEAGAQGLGFQGGVAVDPSQVYAGSHVESGALVDHLHLRPSIDGGFGSGLRVAIIDVTFLYKIPLGTSRWTLFQGTGPTIGIARINDQTNVHGGLGAVFGVSHTNGFLTEFKVSGAGGPNLRFGIGYTVRRRRP
jgi:hypothetical protein